MPVAKQAIVADGVSFSITVELPLNRRNRHPMGCLKKNDGGIDGIFDNFINQ